MHVNTVQYRLRRVEQLTGSLLSTPEGLMEIQLALMIASLSPRDFPSLLAEPVSGLEAALGYPNQDESEAPATAAVPPVGLGAPTRRSRARAPR